MNLHFIFLKNLYASFCIKMRKLIEKKKYCVSILIEIKVKTKKIHCQYREKK